MIRFSLFNALTRLTENTIEFIATQSYRFDHLVATRARGYAPADLLRWNAQRHRYEKVRELPVCDMV